MRLNYPLRPRPIAIIIAGIALLLAVLSLITEYIVEMLLIDTPDSILAVVLDLFSVNLEESIPTWYSVLILFIAALLLTAIAAAKHRNRAAFASHWSGLALLFLYLSMDEGAAIHEILADPLQLAFNTTGFLSFGWQIVAIPLVILFGLVYLRFLFHLPVPTRKLFVLAAALYAGGALIIEGISANQWYLDNGLTMTYLAIATLEELFEMLGVALFIYALLAYIVEMDYSIGFSSGSASENETVADTQAQTSPTYSGSMLARFNPALLIIMLLFITNAASMAWILGQATVTGTADSADLPFYQAIISDLSENEVLIMQMPIAISVENLAAHQLIASLLDSYQEVVVVAIPASDSSVIFAGDTLPFKRDSLTDLLHEDGQIEFIIFETETVRTLSGSIPSQD